MTPAARASASIKTARLVSAGQIRIERVPAPEPSRIHSVAKDGAGRLYLSDEFNHRVIILAPDGGFIKTVGSRGAGPGEFWYPRGLAVVNRAGIPRLVVCDAWNHRIQVFDLEGSHVSSFGAIGEGEGRFNEPCSIMPEKNGDVWILDRCNHRLMLCSLDGKTLKIIGGRMTVRDEDRINDPVVAYSPLEGEPKPVRGFHYPMSATRLENGDFLVADTNNGRLVQMTDEGISARIVSLKGETPPYFHPAWVGNAGDGLIIVRDVSDAAKALDAARPWSETVLETPDGGLASTAALLMDGGGAVTLVDAKNGLINRCSLEPLTPVQPPSFPAGPESSSPSLLWADRTGEDLFSYILSEPESELIGEMAGKLAATLRGEFMKAGNKLAEVESGYLKKAAEYIQLVERMKKERVEKGEPSSETRSDFNWLTVTMRGAEAERNETRRVMLRNLSWLLRLGEAKTPGFTEKRLAGERAILEKTLSSEFANRSDDYQKVLGWLNESAINPVPPPFTALYNAIIGIGLLNGHLRYLDRALKTLKGPDEKKRLEGLPWPLAVCAGIDAATLAEWMFLALGLLRRHNGRYASAIEIYAIGAARDPGNRRRYETEACVAALMSGDVDGAVQRLRSIAAEASSDIQTQLAAGSVLAEHGRDEDALPLLRRALAVLTPDNPLYSTSRRAEIYSLQNAGEPAKALEIVDAELKTSPGSAQAFIWRGDVLRSSLDAEGALNAFYKARERGAGLEADLKIGDLQVLRGHVDEGIKTYESIIANPQVAGRRNIYESAEQGVVRAMHLRGDTAKALARLDSREFMILYCQTAFLRCYISQTMGKLADAEVDITKLAALYPESRGVYARLALIHALSGRVKETGAAVAIERERFPSHQTSYFAGMAWRICGEAEKSLREFENARGMSAISPWIAVERLISAVALGYEKETESAMTYLLSITKKAGMWSWLVFSREERAGEVEKAFSLMESRLRGAGASMSMERRGPLAWWHGVKPA